MSGARVCRFGFTNLGGGGDLSRVRMQLRVVPRRETQPGARMRARPLTSGFPAGSGPTDLPRPRTFSPGLVNGPRQILAAPQGETVILKVSKSPRVHHSFCGDTSRFPHRLCWCSHCKIPMPVYAGLRAPPSGRRWAQRPSLRFVPEPPPYLSSFCVKWTLWPQHVCDPGPLRLC